LGIEFGKGGNKKIRVGGKKHSTTDFTDHTDENTFLCPIRAIRVIRGKKPLPLRQQHHAAIEALRQVACTGILRLLGTSIPSDVVGKHIPRADDRICVVHTTGSA
jgi:hypothetical protein